MPDNGYIRVPKYSRMSAMDFKPDRIPTIPARQS